MSEVSLGGAVAGRSATATVSLGEATREQVIGQLELPHDFVFALAEQRSLGAFGVGPHLHAITHAVSAERKPDLGIRK